MVHSEDGLRGFGQMGVVGNGWNFGVCRQLGVDAEGRKARFVMYKD